MSAVTQPRQAGTFKFTLQPLFINDDVIQIRKVLLPSTHRGSTSLYSAETGILMQPTAVSPHWAAKEELNHNLLSTRVEKK